ncbi:hypothetical protein [Lysobacter sp.]|uniref:hypothetical protein n=1 Tax=Lysobacter sp. TaxID=72226 RepID=UPI002D44907D|nr:hypothetical protein [Lysobacter sp.]HZX79007.1 hypothetical protein [Lysobacter sp.]
MKANHIDKEIMTCHRTASDYRWTMIRRAPLFMSRLLLCALLLAGLTNCARTKGSVTDGVNPITPAGNSLEDKAGFNLETVEFTPPPLNRNPKEAIRIRVEFDKPEDAERYTVTMQAMYQNRKRECGYYLDRKNEFTYPQGTLDIPNRSRERTYAEFMVYRDRFQAKTCNWEMAVVSFYLHDSATGWLSLNYFATSELAPGMVLKRLCQFNDDAFANPCYQRSPPPDVPYRSRVPITIRVSDDSTPLQSAP